MANKRSGGSADKDDEPVVIETKPGSTKDIGGGESDKWNHRQMELMLSALPGAKARDKKSAGEVGSAVVAGLMDVKPTDPIEGMLTSQIIVAQPSPCIVGPGRNRQNISRRNAATCKWLTKRNERSPC